MARRDVDFSGPVHAVRHPLIEVMLTELRDRTTPAMRFRELLEQVGLLLAYEATRDLLLAPHPVQTPLESFRGQRLRSSITIVPILRAGISLSDGILNLIPDAQVGHIGLFRDEDKLSPVHYYEKLPVRVNQGPVLLVDPMLATGGSAMAAVDLLRQRGCRDIRFLCVVAAPEGIRRLHEEDPETPIYVAAVDRELDDRGYILPGLGDAGDRVFGTSDEG